jgi:two-component system, response regulator YesN
MVKVLIVDDEKLTSETIKLNIDWIKLGVDDVFTAYDGIQALEIFSIKKPDIILCDVHMPNMTGIEFAEKVREMDRDVQIIFLSGYSDKEYLKSAIRLNAVDYIEKPISLIELTKVIENSIALSNDNDKRHKGMSQDFELLQDKNYINRKLILEMLGMNTNTSQLQEKFKKLNLDFPVNGSYIAIIAAFNKEVVNKTQNIDKMQEEILEEISGLFDQAKCVSCFINDNNLVIVTCRNTQESHTLKSAANTLKDALNKKWECNLIIGIGKSVSGLQNVYNSYQSAVTAVEKAFFFGDNSVIMYETLSNNEFEFSNDKGNKFIENLKKSDFEKCKHMVGDLISQIRLCHATNISGVKNYFFSWLNSMSNLFEYIDLGSEYYIEEQKYLWDEFSNLHSLKEIENFFIDIIDRLVILMNEKGDKSKIVFNAMQFIRSNYSTDINIKTISGSVNITPNYLSLLFKKEMGITVNYYIMQTRVEEAKKLLKNSNIKLYEVAGLVGFKNQAYFAKVFKKLTDMNPSEYKEKTI